LQLTTVCRRLLLDQRSSRARGKRASEELAVKRERRLLRLVLGMEMGDSVLTIKHADHDAEEDRYDWHTDVLPLARAAA
jgi:hypothetical protein